MTKIAREQDISATIPRTNAFNIVRQFECALMDYTGAPYCVAVNSCTNALFLALKYHELHCHPLDELPVVSIPKKTYVSVPMQIIHSGHKVKFRAEKWRGMYRLQPYSIWDSARRFTSDMFDEATIHEMNEWNDHNYVCLSFHWSKILGIQQGGAILHDNVAFDNWARMARFDGRVEGVPPAKQYFDMLGYHMYMSPEVAAEGLVRLMHIPDYNYDLPNDDYPDLSKMEIFK